MWLNFFFDRFGYVCEKQWLPLEKGSFTQLPGESHFTIGTLFVSVRLTGDDKEAFWGAGEDQESLSS